MYITLEFSRSYQDALVLPEHFPSSSDTSSSHQAIACPPMPVAVCSPTSPGALARYASSPIDNQRRPFTSRISLSGIMNTGGDTDNTDLNDLMLPQDDIDETTFSELIPSVTEPDSGSPISLAFAVPHPVDDLPNPNPGDLVNGWVGGQNSYSKHVLQNSHDACAFGLHQCPTPSLEPTTEGLEWDDSGDLHGLRKLSSPIFLVLSMFQFFLSSIPSISHEVQTNPVVF